MTDDGTVPERGREKESDGIVVPGSDYFSFVLIAILLQVSSILVLIDSTFVPIVTDNAAFWLGFLAWLSQPILVFADANALTRSNAARQPSRIVWPFVAFLPIIGPLLYLTRRINV